MTAATKHTLFLWLDGFFPKRVAYYLLAKALVDSPADLYAGKTNTPNLAIRLLTLEDGRLKDDTSDPKPQGRSTPCLRVEEEGNPTKWVTESAAILLYLEEVYADRKPAMQGPTPLEKANMHDLLSVFGQAVFDGTTYLKNAAPVTTSWSGLKDEERSRDIAVWSKGAMIKGLNNLQRLAGEYGLSETGWLTPGSDGPGIVDMTVAGTVRFLALTYSLDLFQDKELEALRKWYEKFRGLAWWAEVEEKGRHPEKLSHGKGCLEV